MCDEFVCSDSGVGLCEDDRKLLENLGVKKTKKCDQIDAKTSDNNNDIDNNNNQEEANRNLNNSDKGISAAAHLIKSILTPIFTIC